MNISRSCMKKRCVTEWEARNQQFSEVGNANMRATSTRKSRFAKIIYRFSSFFHVPRVNLTFIFPAFFPSSLLFCQLAHELPRVVNKLNINIAIKKMANRFIKWKALLSLQVRVWKEQKKVTAPTAHSLLFWFA